MLDAAPSREELRGADLRRVDRLERRLNQTINRIAELEARFSLLNPADLGPTTRKTNGKKKK